MYTPGESPDTPRKREALAVPTEAEKMPSVRVIPTVNDGGRGVSSQHKSCARPLSVVGHLPRLAPLSGRGRLGRPGGCPSSRVDRWVPFADPRIGG